MKIIQNRTPFLSVEVVLMAFDHTGLFTVIGKYIKWINTLDGYIDALESSKDAVFTVLEAEDLEDLYIGLPTLTTSWQSSLNSWISSLISEVGKVLVDRDYVIEQLVLNATDVTTVLNAIYNYMVDNSYSFKPSVVSIGGSDVHLKNFFITDAVTNLYSNFYGICMVTRRLDGANAPSSVVTAHQRYNQIESQLAKSTTVYARITTEPSADTRGTVELFSKAPITTPYVLQEEEPGNGPSLSDMESDNIISNFDFSTFVSDTPTSWTMGGGVETTDWEQTTAYSDMPATLQINTVDVTLKQQVTLSRYNMYCAAVYAQNYTSDDSESTIDYKIEFVNSAGTALTTQDTVTASGITGLDSSNDNPETYPGIFRVAYAFFSPKDTTDLDNIYVQVKVTDLSDDGGGGAAPVARIYKVVCAPVTYYNGLGWTYWNPAINVFNSLSDTGSFAIANNDAGVFQSYFRKAHNVQMPTNDSNTVNDALAT